MSNELVKTDDLGALEKWGIFASKAGLIPQGTTAYQAMAIIQAGKEMGLQPLQALRSMSFIRGRLTMSVQAQLALAKEKCKVVIKELKEQNGTCEVTLNRDNESVTCQYTLDDAKKAGLIKPDGTYDKYPRQMLRWRAIGDALRMIAPDLILNLLSPEEAETIIERTPETGASEKAQTKAEELQKKLAKVKTKEPLLTESEPTMPEGTPPPTMADLLISEAQLKRFHTICSERKIPVETAKRYLKNFYGIESSKNIQRDWYEDIMNWAQKWQDIRDPGAEK